MEILYEVVCFAIALLTFWGIQDMYECVQLVRFLPSGLQFINGKREEYFSLTEIGFFFVKLFIYLIWKMTCFSLIIMFSCHHPKGLGSVSKKNLTSRSITWSPSKVRQNFESYSSGQ